MPPITTRIPFAQTGRAVTITAVPGNPDRQVLSLTAPNDAPAEFTISRDDAVRLVAALSGHFVILPPEVSMFIQHVRTNPHTFTLGQDK